MKKASGIISLLLALLLISAGCFGALAQEPADPEGEVIVQDNAAQEAAEREAVEQAAKEAAEQEAAEQAAKEAAEKEKAEQASQEAEEQETAEQAATEKEEKQNEIPADIPSENEETEKIEDEAEASPVADLSDQTGNQAANDAATEELFTANISIELTNTGVIHLGDELQLKAVVDGANRSYEISWQTRERLASADTDPDWLQVETGETYQLILTEEAVELEYRVLLTADNDQTVASKEYCLPEPALNDELPAETTPETNPAPGEEESPLTAEETENKSGSEALLDNADPEEAADQAPEEVQLIVPEVSPENPDTPDEEDRDLELAWNEIIVVTETDPETDPEPEVAEQSGENPEVTDDNSGKSQTPDENGEDQETAENSGEEQEAPEETNIDSQTLEENEEEPAVPAEEELPKERKVRVFSSRGETIVCGETICNTVDLSDFADCAQVSVVWEADKGSGWEEVGTGENFEYIASAESIFWLIRARVRYMP